IARRPGTRRSPRARPAAYVRPQSPVLHRGEERTWVGVLSRLLGAGGAVVQSRALRHRSILLARVGASRQPPSDASTSGGVPSLPPSVARSVAALVAPQPLARARLHCLERTATVRQPARVRRQLLDQLWGIAQPRLVEEVAQAVARVQPQKHVV